MRPRRARGRRLRPYAQGGFTVIEVLAAMLLLTIGIIGMIGAFDSARKLTLLSERRTSMAHRAQREIERLQAIPYGELAMYEAPKHSASKENPDYYVTESGTEYQYGEAKAETEPLVVEKVECSVTVKENCGAIWASPTGRKCTSQLGACEWTDGRLSGSIYDFVTWHTDKVCELEEKGTKFCSTKSYKRLTVVVTVNVSSGHTVSPVRVSTLIVNPSAAPEGSVKNGIENPLENPTTKCGSESCITGIQRGSPQSWYLHDSPASSETASEPTKSHATHATVAPSGTCTSSNTSGCPTPDLMTSAKPGAKKLYDYSTDQDGLGATVSLLENGECLGELRTGACYGGRLLKADVECKEKETPKPTETENTKGELWVTDPLSAETKLTGYGGLSIYTQTIGGVSATATLCVGVYEMPKSIANLTKTGSPGKLLGAAGYTPSTWPTSLTELSFVFKFLESGTATIPKEDRIGIRVWPAASSTSAIAIAYDTTASTGTEVVEGQTVEKAGYESHVQLNTE